jgi:hypothetical protein
MMYLANRRLLSGTGFALGEMKKTQICDLLYIWAAGMEQPSSTSRPFYLASPEYPVDTVDLRSDGPDASGLAHGRFAP